MSSWTSVPPGGAGPGALHLEPAAAEHDRAGSAGVTGGGAFRELGVLGPDPGGQLLHHLDEHPHAHRHAHGQQSLPGGAGQLAEGQGQLVGELGQPGRLVTVDEADGG